MTTAQWYYKLRKKIYFMFSPLFYSVEPSHSFFFNVSDLSSPFPKMSINFSATYSRAS